MHNVPNKALSSRANMDDITFHEHTTTRGCPKECPLWTEM